MIITLDKKRQVERFELTMSAYETDALGHYAIPALWNKKHGLNMVWWKMIFWKGIFKGNFLLFKQKK